MVVASKVKVYVKDKQMQTSSDAIIALSDKVCAILDEATERAKAKSLISGQFDQLNYSSKVFVPPCRA